MAKAKGPGMIKMGFYCMTGYFTGSFAVSTEEIQYFSILTLVSGTAFANIVEFFWYKLLDVDH